MQKVTLHHRVIAYVFPGVVSNFYGQHTVDALKHTLIESVPPHIPKPYD